MAKSKIVKKILAKLIRNGIRWTTLLAERPQKWINICSDLSYIKILFEHSLNKVKL